MQRRLFSTVALAASAAVFNILPATAAELQVLLPLGRTSYQTNELIDISVVRSDAAPLAAGTLTMTVTGADNSKMAFTFPTKGGAARTTENLRLNGWLLRPQKYTVAVASDGATAQTALAVYSHIRKSSYRTVHWGGPSGEAMIPEGEDGMGFNLILNGKVSDQEPSIAAGADVMGLTLMGGCHQHDCKLNLDWSDPNVYIGAMQRGVDNAFQIRTMPNAIGAHLHDEPGLTWAKHPRTGEFGPHDIAPQREAYARVYGEEPIWFDEVNTKDPAQYEKWKQVSEFKLGLMDAFWKATNENVSRLKPGFLAVTQSQYGWYSLSDGYYFNVARSLPVISGHGGYNDFWLRNMNPSFFLEMALPRQLDKPTWYLPEWYGSMSADAFREEHNLSFITGIQGMSTPPEIGAKAPAAPAVTEANQLYQRLGTIFTVPEYTRQDVTLLYSKSTLLYNKQQGSQANLGSMYLATKLAQYPISVVLEEDVVDGTLAASHKAVILTGITHLEAPVIAGLTAFAKNGGTIIQTVDNKVKIPGAVTIAIDPEAKYNQAIAAAQKITDEKARTAALLPLNTFRAKLELAQPVAKLLKAELVKAGIMPAFVSSVDTIAAGKQVRGEIEYDFAVNFTPEAGHSEATGGYGVPIKASSTITLAGDRPTYNAISGGLMPVKKTAGGVSATLEFGPGQMYALARTARPIGGVQVGLPTINRDFTRESDPLRVEFTASLMDTENKLLAGNAPMQIKLTDPNGVVRYNLYRAAQKGILSASLPLAANDPAGQWTVTVTELLNNSSGTSSFTYNTAAQVGALAGAVPNAMHYGPDKANVYRFFRSHRNISIVPGTSEYSAAAARRLVEIMKPYNVNATIVSLDQANKARPLTDEQALTWAGNQAAGTLNAEARGNAKLVGYNLPGPTVLIGNAGDNPLIAFLQERKVLPYTPTADFPGVGNGMVAWNIQTLGHDIESIALIGNDAAGVNEAVQTAFLFGVGIDPLTPLVFPAASSMTVPAKVAVR